MSKFLEMFKDEFHSSDRIDVAKAKVFESRYNINLLSHKAVDPEQEWTCSMAESEEDDMFWFWVSTVDTAHWITTNNDTLFPVSEAVCWPRSLTADAIAAIDSRLADQAVALGDNSVVMVSANPTLAHWLYVDDAGETMISLTMSKSDTFVDPEFNLHVYDKSLEPVTPRSFQPGTFEKVRSIIPSRPEGYTTFTFDNTPHLLVTDEDGDYYVFTYSLMRGLTEVEGDAFDRIFPITEFINDRQKTPFPTA